MRKNNRKNDELRPVSIERGFQPHADGSVLIAMGGTHVLCSVTIEKSVPPFLKDSGRGWLTAEYGILPCATHSRIPREAIQGRRGRTYEIQRLIGRSLRAMVDLSLLGENTLRVDCDVIRADGGTRTAAITGAALAVRDAVGLMYKKKLIEKMVPLTPIAAISAGLVNGIPILDLDYEEDSKAHVDANFVMTGDNKIIEIQCTAEGRPFSRDDCDDLLELATKGISELIPMWQEEK